jgi:hypothetical protein
VETFPERRKSHSKHSVFFFCSHHHRHHHHPNNNSLGAAGKAKKKHTHFIDKTKTRKYGITRFHQLSLTVDKGHYQQLVFPVITKQLNFSVIGLVRRVNRSSV